MGLGVSQGGQVELLGPPSLGAVPAYSQGRFILAYGVDFYNNFPIKEIETMSEYDYHLCLKSNYASFIYALVLRRTQSWQSLEQF